LELSFIRNLEGDPTGWAAAARQVAEAAEAAGERLPTTIGRAWEGTGSCYGGRFDDAEAGLRRAIAIAGADGNVHFHALGLALLATSLALGGRIEEAFPVLQEGKAVNPDWREGNLGEWEIVVHCLAGDFDAALSCARESVSWNTAGMSRRRAHGMVFAALAGVEAGRVVEARRYLDVARAAYGDRPWGPWPECCSFAEGVLAGHRGEVDQALTVLGRSAERLQGMGYLPFAAIVLLELAEVAGEIREVQVVTGAAARLDEITSRIDRDLYRGLAATGAAWAQLASGAGRSGTEAAEEAARLMSTLPYPCLLGRALDVLGRSLASTDRARAREVLGRAVATFDACGATWRRDRVLRALRRLGEAGKRAAAALGPSVLTAREAEVARLAVRGETAAEIGHTLFIGTRTVESHLARVYAKLGVASKYELIQRAAELGLDDPAEPVGP
ncbi:MAG: LuxR C-terminal-related transcriptional regulator, partial [Acidimicrobiia bacterium]